MLGDNHKIIPAIATANQAWSNSDWLCPTPAPQFPAVEQLYQQALALQKQLQFTEAIAQYPQYALAWYQLGVIMDNQGQTNQAVLAYQHALTINPKYAIADNNLGIMQVAQKNLEKAIALATEIFKILSQMLMNALASKNRRHRPDEALCHPIE